LAYVTPWNSHGYDVAKVLGERFDYVAPVWFQIRQSEHGQAQITGLHDIDRGWIKAVRAPCADQEYSRFQKEKQKSGVASKCPRIVPRFVWEARSLSDAEQGRVIPLIVDVIVSNGLDGLVLEAPVSRPMMQWLQSLRTSLDIATATARQGLQPLELVLVLPPPVVQEGQLLQGLDRAGLVEAAKYVDRFSLMTYDYSTGR